MEPLDYIPLDDPRLVALTEVVTKCARARWRNVPPPYREKHMQLYAQHVADGLSRGRTRTHDFAHTLSFGFGWPKFTDEQRAEIDTAFALLFQ